MRSRLLGSILAQRAENSSLKVTERQFRLLGFRLSFGEFPALAPAGRNLVPGTLYATLPRDEAFRRAAEAHPGLRAPPPEGGVLRECLRRHGVVGTWTDLPALVPDLAPDATAAAAIKDAEQAGLEGQN